MSSCNEYLYDYDLVKKCYKCGIISIKSNYPTDKTKNDGIKSNCKVCRKNYNYKNLVKIKKYYLENRDKIITQQDEYINIKYKTDISFRLICKTRSRIQRALKGKWKPSSTIGLLGIDIDTYWKWIELQMTPDMTWDNIEIDHVKAICMFDVSKDEELKEVFNWKNTQPLLKQDHQQKGIKFIFLDYQLRFIQAHQFLKLNEERLNEELQC